MRWVLGTCLPSSKKAAPIPTSKNLRLYDEKWVRQVISAKGNLVVQHQEKRSGISFLWIFLSALQDQAIKLGLLHLEGFIALS